jgi:hypothetical protein
MADLQFWPYIWNIAQVYPPIFDAKKLMNHSLVGPLGE